MAHGQPSSPPALTRTGPALSLVLLLRLPCWTAVTGIPKFKFWEFFVCDISLRLIAAVASF